MSNQPPERRRYLFLLSEPGEKAIEFADNYLHELGVRVTTVFRTGALAGLATPQHVEAAATDGYFAVISKGSISEETQTKLRPEHADAVRVWNTKHSPDLRELKQKDIDKVGASWGDEKYEQRGPSTRIDPDDFRYAVLKQLGVSEKELIEKYLAEHPQSDLDRSEADQRDQDKGEPGKPNVTNRIHGDEFIKFERELGRRLKDIDLAYEGARVAYDLGPEWTGILLWIDPAILLEILRRLFDESEVGCWKLENRIAVGVVFVESGRRGGPTFTTGQRNTLEAEISDGLEWLAGQAPWQARLTWALDWQRTRIDVPNGTNDSDEQYWRDPAIGEVNFHGATYTADLTGLSEYRSDLRWRNQAAHAFVIFVTPYGTDWHGQAFPSRGQITLANRNDWGGWGIGTIDRITAHETSHLFGAPDEYTGSGTPCSSCDTLHGCYRIPNGNCGTCSRSGQSCIMGGNDWRLCSWTRGHLGWSDLFVELTTVDEFLAGTDDTVWLDIGERTFELDTPDYDDREQNNRDGCGHDYTGVTREDIQRVGIRKSTDGVFGGWKLRRVKLRLRGELVCDSGTINEWLEDHHRWWASSRCGSSNDIVNELQVWVSTGDVWWAGTDDDVTLRLGGRSWNLDNEWHDDFEQGHTDSFQLDPGTGLYRSHIGAIQIRKSPDGIAGGWRLKGLRIAVNGATIFDNQNINRWLEDDNRTWSGHI